MRNNKVTAVIVTYNPDAEHFTERLNLICEQVENVIVIDNSTDSSWLDNSQLESTVKFISLKENKGIAYAQNIGIFEAYKLDSEYIITFDQDSKIPSDFVGGVINEYLVACEVLGETKVACIGPSVINERDGNLYTKYFNGARRINEDIYSVRSIISSGTLFNKKVFSYVGLMCSPWFIDSIDIEWCYRARAYGLHVLMTKNVSMSHNLGANDQPVAFGKKINTGAPIRLYYVYRNWIFSLRLPYFPMKYKLKLLAFMPIKILIFSMINPGKERFNFIRKGIVDGVRGRYGIISNSVNKIS